MKKIKFILQLLMVTVVLFSCEKEDETKIIISNQDLVNKQMNSKISDVENFRQKQEDLIFQKILTRNNLTVAQFEEFKKNPIINNIELDKKQILESVRFYHEEKLKSIYLEREFVGFTSIQSIADEINFNKLINPKKADELLNKHSNLYDNSFNCVKPKSDGNINLVLNINDYKNTGSKNATKESKNLSSRQTAEGVYASNVNNRPPLADFGMTITWHAGVVNNNKGYTQFGCFLFGYLYPSQCVNGIGNASFPGNNPGVLGFPPSGYGSIIRIEMNLNSNLYNFLGSGSVYAERFYTVFNGGFYNINCGSTVAF